MELIRKKFIDLDRDASDSVRIIVFLDKQHNGSASILVTDILETANWKSFNNLANTGRFKIFKDTIIPLNYLTLAFNGLLSLQSALARSYVFEFHKKCSIPIEMSDSTGSLAAIRSNNIGIMMISESNLNSTVTLSTRIRYTDA